MSMCDIHTHLIPFVDDGASSLEETIKLIKMEIENGVTDIICTPHQREGLLNKYDLLSSFFNLKETLNDFPINLYLGSEILYYDNLVNDLKADKVLTMNNTKYILLEFPTSVEVDIPSAVYELVVEGYIPIVAHIERYSYLKYEDYDIIKRTGGLISINSSSIKGIFTSKRCKYLLKKGICDFVCSDCHDSINRLVDFKKSKRFIKSRLGYRKSYERLFEVTPCFLNN